MGKRFEPTSFEKLLHVIEENTGRRLSDTERRTVRAAPTRSIWLNSGLEESMAVAYDQIREVWKADSKIPSLRTAAFIGALYFQSKSANVIETVSG